MASKVPAEIHELVPEELRSKYGIYWSSKGERYYVFRDVAHVYDPSKKRSSVKRVALGSIKDGVYEKFRKRSSPSSIPVCTERRWRTPCRPF